MESHLMTNGDIDTICLLLHFGFVGSNG